MRISLENPSKDKINIFGVPESLVALHHCTWSPSPQSSWSRCRCSYCGCGHCPGHWQLNSPTHAQCTHTHTPTQLHTNEVHALRIWGTRSIWDPPKIHPQSAAIGILRCRRSLDLRSSPFEDRK